MACLCCLVLGSMIYGCSNGMAHFGQHLVLNELGLGSMYKRCSCLPGLQVQREKLLFSQRAAEFDSFFRAPYRVKHQLPPASLSPVGGHQSFASHGPATPGLPGATMLFGKPVNGNFASQPLGHSTVPPAFGVGAGAGAATTFGGSASPFNQSPSASLRPFSFGVGSPASTSPFGTAASLQPSLGFGIQPNQSQFGQQSAGPFASSNPGSFGQPNALTPPSRPVIGFGSATPAAVTSIFGGQPAVRPANYLSSSSSQAAINSSGSDLGPQAPGMMQSAL